MRAHTMGSRGVRMHRGRCRGRRAPAHAETETETEDRDGASKQQLQLQVALEGAAGDANKHARMRMLRADDSSGMRIMRMLRTPVRGVEREDGRDGAVRQIAGQIGSRPGWGFGGVLGLFWFLLGRGFLGHTSFLHVCWRSGMRRWHVHGHRPLGAEPGRREQLASKHPPTQDIRDCRRLISGTAVYDLQVPRESLPTLDEIQGREERESSCSPGPNQGIACVDRGIPNGLAIGIAIGIATIGGILCSSGCGALAKSRICT